MKPITRHERYLAAISNDPDANGIDSPETRIEQYLAKIAGETTPIPDKPITRIEQYLAKIAGEDVEIPSAPITRIEMYLDAIVNGETDTPEPITREEYYLSLWAAEGIGELKTITGALLQITDALAKPAKKLVVSFEAVQEGEGDPSLENIRPIIGWTGVDVLQSSINLIPLTLPVHAFAGTFSTGSSTISSATNGRCWAFYVGRNQRLIYQKKSGAGSTAIMAAFADSLLTSRTGAVIYDAINLSSRQDYVMNSGEHPYMIVQTSNASALTPKTGVWDVNESMLSFGNTRKEYSPRTDLTTIPIAFPSNSKNLYDKRRRTEYFYINQDGVIAADSNSCYSDLIPVVAGETYTWSGEQAESTSNNKRIHAYTDGVWQSQILSQAVDQSGAFAITFQVPNGANQIRVSEYLSDTNVQIELGSTATTYEEYTQYYGGTLTINEDGSGELVSTYKRFNLGDLGWKKETGRFNSKYIYELAESYNKLTTLCEVYKSYPNSKGSEFNSNAPDGSICVITNGAHPYLGLKDSSYDDATSLIASLVDKYIICERSTPITYTLTSQQVLTLFAGVNNIWADANGQLELTYLAQTEAS